MKNAIQDLRRALGSRVRELRKSAGLTQEDLEEKSGINYKYIGELERGKVNISVDSLVRIAGALEVNIGDLFSKEAVPVQRVIVKEKNPLSKLSPKDIQTIKKAIRLLNKTFSMT